MEQLLTATNTTIKQFVLLEGVVSSFLGHIIPFPVQTADMVDGNVLNSLNSKMSYEVSHNAM